MQSRTSDPSISEMKGFLLLFDEMYLFPSILDLLMQMLQYKLVIKGTVYLIRKIVILWWPTGSQSEEVKLMKYQFIK